MSKVLEAGFRWHPYDLTVTDVTDIERSATFLCRLEVNAVTPEHAHGRWWRVPQRQPLEVIREKLRDLPITFGPQPLDNVARFINLVRDTQRDKALVFDVCEHQQNRVDSNLTRP